MIIPYYANNSDSWYKKCVPKLTNWKPMNLGKHDKIWMIEGKRRFPA